MNVIVTWADILNGNPASTHTCMVALALQRELGVPYASVGHRDATVRIAGQDVKLYLPKEVEDKIRFWDRFHFVRPFQFELICSGFLTGTAITRRLSQPAFAGQKVSFA
jgi:hypothetical protein